MDYLLQEAKKYDIRLIVRHVVFLKGSLGFADGWPDVTTEDTDWHDYEVTLYVPDDAIAIRFGLLLQGGGDIYIDDLELLVSEGKEFANPVSL